MRQFFRKVILDSVRYVWNRLPYLPIMSWLNIFAGLRTARRYLTHLCRLDPCSVPTTGALVTPPNRNRYPSRIWLITELTWEPEELIPEMKKIGQLFTTDLCPARQGAETRAKVVELLDRAKPDMQPDLIWLYAREGLLSEDVFRVLRKYDVPIWGMNSDDKADFFPREHSPYAGRDGYGRWVRFFDMNLSVCRAMVPHYLAAGARVAYSPEGFYFRPEFEEPRPPVKDVISFVAAWREVREEMIASLRRYGIPVQVYGRGWKDSQWAKTPWEIFRASQLTLGDGVSFGSPMTNLKGRDFEAPGSHACYVTSYDWELADQFDIGREILCYRDFNDLVELLHYYQGRPDECARIAKAGFERAREYTWEKRFRKVMARWF
jgi:hypothetical protein